ncbi:MAG: prolyl oligopeptidase family serine peptidase [Bacteroidetes bacterium]|nr:prolyl oligopeptidase family serine peptidase [Bacteroidota bacterium]
MSDFSSKIKLFFFSCVSTLLFSCGLSGQSDNVFEKHEFYFNSGDTLFYRMMKPKKNNPSKKYPLVLFLHGAGERGNDNNSQLANGVNNFASSQIRETYPCYMIVPQCAKNYRWVEVPWNLSSHVQPEKPSVYLEQTIKLLDSLIKKLNIDTNRIYITGLSMGGFGTWDAICRYPWKFAAAVPICGGGDTAKAASIKNIPIWAFHGGKDKVVMVSRSRDMIAAIKKAGGNPIYTEYPETGHDAYTKTYKSIDLYKWLFSQTKSKQGKR